MFHVKHIPAKALRCNRYRAQSLEQGPAKVPVMSFFVSTGDLQQAPFVEGPANQLEADRQISRSESARDGDGRKARVVRRTIQTKQAAAHRLFPIGCLCHFFVNGRRRERHGASTASTFSNAASKSARSVLLDASARR